MLSSLLLAAVLVNGPMETQDGWVLYNNTGYETEKVHGGQQALRMVSGGEFNSGFYQDVEIAKGEHTLTVWIVNEGSHPGYVQISLCGTSVQSDAIASWKSVRVTGEQPAGTCRVELQTFGEDGISVVADDAKLEGE